MGNTVTTPEEQLDEPVTDKHTDSGSMIVPGKLAGGSSRASGRGSRKQATKQKSQQRDGSLIRFAASSMQGWRPTNEDHHLLIPSITIPLPSAQWGAPITLRDHSFFAVFDGHGGGFTSNYAGHNLKRVLCDRKEWSEYLSLSERERADVPGIELLKSALAGAFIDLDDELYRIHRGIYVPEAETNVDAEGRDDGEDGSDKRRPTAGTGKVTGATNLADAVSAISAEEQEMLRGDRSGSTAVAVLLTPSHVICANAGDSRAVLVRSGVAFPMSFDHKPTTPCEHGRIVNAMGRVHMKRVDGDLAVSRGFGDFRFKGNSDLKVEHQKVSNSPDVIVNPRNEAGDEFIIIACDGIWDVLGNQDCARTVQGLLDEGETNIGMLCEEMLDICLEKDSRDNMTFCMVALPSCKIMAEEEKARAGLRGVEGRREAREKKGVTPGQSRRARKAAAKAERAARKAAKVEAAQTIVVTAEGPRPAAD
mmetsp:Transcript_5235/g.11367  ORF Transcript_5235/g.11367 Transcript_5235/m.11367 type:complete len:478 (-) Transcript_5235:127-1560(-)